MQVFCLKFGVGRSLLYNWTLLKNIVSPFGIGKAIPRLCVCLMRWFTMFVLPGKKKNVFDVQKRKKKKISMVYTV